MRPFQKPSRQRRLTSAVAWLSIVLTVPGCGAVIPPQGGSVPTGEKTIAVISLLPNTLSLGYIGLTVFQNKFAIVPSEFDPNSYLLQVASNDLSKDYQVVTPQVNRAKIFSDIKSAKPNSWLPLSSYVITDPLVQSELRQQIQPGAADLIVVFDGTEPDNIPDKSNPGVGLVSSGAYMQGGDTFTLLVHVEIFDGHSFQEITSSDGYPTDDIPSDLHWNGQSYDSISALDKTEMSKMEQLAIEEHVMASLQHNGLIQQ